MGFFDSLSAKKEFEGHSEPGASASDPSRSIRFERDINNVTTGWLKEKLPETDTAVLGLLYNIGEMNRVHSWVKACLKDSYKRFEAGNKHFKDMAIKLNAMDSVSYESVAGAEVLYFERLNNLNKYYDKRLGLQMDFINAMADYARGNDDAKVKFLLAAEKKIGVLSASLTSFAERFRDESRITIDVIETVVGSTLKKAVMFESQSKERAERWRKEYDEYIAFRKAELSMASREESFGFIFGTGVYLNYLLGLKDGSTMVFNNTKKVFEIYHKMLTLATQLPNGALKPFTMDDIVITPEEEKAILSSYVKKKEADEMKAAETVEAAIQFISDDIPPEPASRIFSFPE